MARNITGLQFSDLNAREDQSLHPSLDSMQSQIQQNYSLAAQWYAQRKMAFANALMQDCSISIESFTAEINKKIQDWQKYVQGPVMAAINGYAPTGSGGPETAELIVTRDQLIGELGIGKHQFTKASTMLGDAFEKMLGQSAVSAGQLQAIGDYRNQIIDGVLAQFGSLQNVSAATAGRSTATRVDVGYIAKGANASSNSQLELTTLVDIADIQAQIGEIDLEDLMSSLPTGNVNLDIYGFQVKTYKDLDDQRWSQGAAAAKAINSLMEEFRNGRTWSSVYAALYPTYFLSRFLFNIIAPNNIGIMSRAGGVLYMDQFLHNYQFYMEVYATGPSSPQPSHRPAGQEIFPAVLGTTILMKNVGAGGSLTLLAAQSNRVGVHKTKQHFGSDDPRKQIKVLTLTRAS